MYSTCRDDGRVKRSRGDEHGNTSRNNEEQDRGSKTASHGTRPASALKGDNPQQHRKSANDTILLAQPEQELQDPMARLGEPEDLVTEDIVTSQQRSLMEELESDLDLADGSIFDVIPSFDPYTPKSFHGSSGSAAKADVDHEMGFVSGTAQNEMVSSHNWHVSPPPSVPLINTQMPHDMSGCDSDYFLRSPSSEGPSAAEKALQPIAPIKRQTISNLPAKQLSCTCLVTKVSLLEELGSQKVDRSLHEVLATHKDYTMKCWSVLECQVCMSKSESVMLLVLVYERLVDFCESMADAYLKDHAPPRSGLTSPGPERARLTVGKYAIDKDEEYDCLMGALTLHQVKVLGRQLFAIRRPASILLRGGQISKLLTCERKMRALAERLRSQ